MARRRMELSGVNPRRVLQRTDDSDCVRQPDVLEQSGDFQHGEIAGFVACLHAGLRCAVPAGADGPTAARQSGRAVISDRCHNPVLGYTRAHFVVSVTRQ